MSLEFDEDTPFLDDRLKKLNNKIKSLKKAIEDSTARGRADVRTGWPGGASCPVRLAK